MHGCARAPVGQSGPLNPEVAAVSGHWSDQWEEEGLGRESLSSWDSLGHRGLTGSGGGGGGQERNPTGQLVRIWS